MKGVFTIGIDRRFADELAQGVLAESWPRSARPGRCADPGADPALGTLALREAFLRASDGKPTILPRMAPLGDVDDSEWDLSPGDDTALALPPAIDPTEREALLAQLVAAFKDDQGHPMAQSASAGAEARARTGRAAR